MAEQEPIDLNLKEGTLSESLGIRPEDDIPASLLRAIIDTTLPSGEESTEIENPAFVGKRVIKVTKLMKKRAVFAHTARHKWGMGN